MRSTGAVRRTAAAIALALIYGWAQGAGDGSRFGQVASPAAAMPPPAPREPSLLAGWKPPLGIPPPPFGLAETAPPPPESWTNAVAGFYYVEPAHPRATDAGNPFGKPGVPRRTIPVELPPGAVVEVHGIYEQEHTQTRRIAASGTADRPVFIRGRSAGEKPVLTEPFHVGGAYLVLENLEFAFRASEKGALAIVGPAHYVALRRCDVHGNRAGGGAAVAGGPDGASHVVLYANRIHDNGDWQTGYDQDVHGIRVAARVSHLWILENELFRNSGDGLQISAGKAAQDSTHHVYVGRNTAYQNKQMGFWTKQAVDVIFSENLSYDHRPSGSSFGAGMGFQYAPERVWFLFNHIHDCDVGIGTASDNDLGSGRDSYYVGNVIHRIHHTGAKYNPATAWSNAGLMLAGGINRYVVNNTIHDVDAGINSPSGRIEIAGNIVSKVTEPLASHVFVERENSSALSSMRHNLFEGDVRIRWGSSRPIGLGDFRGATGKGQRCISGAPLFVDPDREDFGLQARSPAIDAAVEEAVYTRFRDLYGIDIARDAAGRVRPQGRGWDIGASERASP